MYSSFPGQRKGIPTLFIAGLNESVDEEAIIRHFERLDKTIKLGMIHIKREILSLKPRGFGFIEFPTQEDCKFYLLV